MKKFMFFPLWKINKLENKLNEMEKQGYRLDYIKYAYWFYFKESKSKNSDYIITYTMPKDNHSGMYEYGYELLSEYSANEIKSTQTIYNVYRITGENRDFKDLIAYRDKYFQRVYFQYMIISLFFLLISIVPMILSLIFDGAIITDDVNSFALDEFVFLMIMGVVSLLFAIYYFYGYIQQKKKVKKWQQDNLNK